MDLFWRLVLGHVLADFTFQTNKLAGWKRESTWGMIVHVITHPVVSLLVALPYLRVGWYETSLGEIPGWVCILAIGFCHWAQDEFRVWLIQAKGWKDSTLLFMADQVCHIATLYLVAPAHLIDVDLPPIWVWFLLGTAVLAHFVSVLIYFLERDLLGSSTVLSQRKYPYMVERLIGASLFLIPGWGIVLSFAWFGWLIVSSRKKLLPRTRIHILTALFSVLVIGLTLRSFIV